MALPLMEAGFVGSRIAWMEATGGLTKYADWLAGLAGTEVATEVLAEIPLLAETELAGMEFTGTAAEAITALDTAEGGMGIESAAEAVTEAGIEAGGGEVGVGAPSAAELATKEGASTGRGALSAAQKATGVGIVAIGGVGAGVGIGYSRKAKRTDELSAVKKSPARAIMAPLEFTPSADSDKHLQALAVLGGSYDDSYVDKHLTNVEKEMVANITHHSHQMPSVSAVLASIMPLLPRKRSRSAKRGRSASPQAAIFLLNNQHLTATDVDRMRVLQVMHPADEPLHPENGQELFTGQRDGKPIDERGLGHGCMTFAVPGLDAPVGGCYVSIDLTQAANETQVAFLSACEAIFNRNEELHQQLVEQNGS